MTFKVGEQVVHPRHGVGKVAKLVEREFERGMKRQYYEISISSGETVWVPVDLETSGLRKLAAHSEIARCREILKSRPSPLNPDFRFRQAELATRLQQGTIFAQCEVVRDLFASAAYKSLSGPIGNFFQSVQDVLCQEWAAVEGVSVTEAAQEVYLLLERHKKTSSQQA